LFVFPLFFHPHALSFSADTTSRMFWRYVTYGEHLHRSLTSVLLRI
jgi:hypothetical protein